MSVRHIYENAQLGALVAFSDGSAQPPAIPHERFVEWQWLNGVGRLVMKQPSEEYPFHTEPPSITLRAGDFSAGTPGSAWEMRTFSIDSRLTFRIAEPPPVGAFRVIRDADGTMELLHLAENLAAAERWLTTNPDTAARLAEITADEVVADVVEGRAA